MASFRVSTLAGASSSLDTMGTGERAGAMAVTLAAMCGAVLLDQIRADVCGKPSSDSWEGEWKQEEREHQSEEWFSKAWKGLTRR